MIFRHFLLSVNEANAFLMACSETREAMLIDAGEVPGDLAGLLQEHGLNLAKVFITHDHYDHTGGLPDIVETYQPQVFAAAETCGGVAVTERVKQGSEVTVGAMKGVVLETPGHTPDGVSLAFPGFAFSGDALFAGSIGGTASPALAKSLISHVRKQLFSLPPDTEIYTGHGAATTVAIERDLNPFFQ